MSKQSEKIWSTLRVEASEQACIEPMLGSFFHANILNHNSLGSALSFLLANKLDSSAVPALLIREIVENALQSDDRILTAACADIEAIRERDPAVDSYLTPFMYLKGFHALQSYRIAHWLWFKERRSLALFLQNQISVVFGVDIHPAAQIGKGIMLDHATGIVIGETSVVEDDVSILQSVTLGGTGKECGDRHPKIRSGVLISAGSKILGNIEVGEGAKVGAGSVVLKPVAPHTTVAGVPARVMGAPTSNKPALDMNQAIDQE
ncbi:MAG: serine O-acetyltransferase [Motiliproteus sp.]